MLRLLKAKMRQTARAALLAFVLAPVPIANGAAQAQTETTPAVSQELTYEKLHDMRGAVLERRANLRKQRGQIADARLLKNFERALRADTDDFFDQAMRPKARALRISCSEKDWDACLALAEMYQVGDGTWPDEHLAFAFHIAGCSARDPASCREVWQNWRLDAANGRYEGHSPHLEVINDTCAAGDGDSCHQLSRGTKFGINGVAKNQSEAERLLQRACMLGNQRACRDLPKTPAEQAARHQALCDNGKQFYCFLLGEAMHTGDGIKKDVVAGEAIIRESCVSGSSHACQWVFETYDTSTQDRISLLEQGCSATPGRICNEAIRLLEKQPQNTQTAARIETLNGLACTSDDAYCKRTIWYWIDDAGNQTDPFDPGSDGFFDKPQWAAVRVARQACQVQDFDGCKHFAELFAKSGDRLGGLLAAYIFRPFCEAGDGNICLLMADYIPMDSSLKLPIYRLACEAGVLEGCLKQAINDKNLSPAEQLAPLQEACAYAHIFACRMQAEFLENAPGVSATPRADRARSEALFRFACEGGDMQACTRLGRVLYERGRRRSGEPDRLREALALFKKACEAQNAQGCDRLGVHYEYDADLEENALEKALEYYGAACQLEPHHLCVGFERSTLQKERNKLRAEHGAFASALMAHEADFKVDYQARVRRYRRDCSEGDLEQCVTLGDRYLDKLEVDGIYGLKETTAPDWDWARALYAHACDKDIALGCERLANTFHYGGPQTDLTLAFKHAQRGCDLGDHHSCHRLASFLAKGEAVEVDLYAAERLYRRACDLGEDFSCQQLASYEMWEGDPTTRQERFELACVHGSWFACGSIRDRLREMGPLRNRDVIRALFEVSCDEGDKDACEAIGRRVED